MTTLELVLLGVIVLHVVWKWVRKDNADFREMSRMLEELNLRHEEAYAKMRSRIENEGERVEEMLEMCRKTLASLHKTDIDKKVEEWQAEHREEMEELRHRRDLASKGVGV